MWAEYDDSKHPSRLTEGQGEEAVLESFYRKQLTEIAMSRFKWSNLPEGMESRFIEQLIHFKGLAVFFKLDFYDRYFCTAGNASGMTNVYDNPTQFGVYGNGIKPKNLSYSNVDIMKECVPIWGNFSRTSSVDIVNIYARRLARVDRTLDINATNARMPRVFRGSDNAKLSAMNVNRQINSGSDFLILTDQMADGLDTLDMGIDVNIFEKMHVYRVRLYNECMGLLGIDNANSEKRERLVEGEIDANEEQTDVNRQVAMNTREYAADEINRIYDLNVQVEYFGVGNGQIFETSL